MKEIHLSKEDMTEEELEEYLAYKKWTMDRLMKMFPGDKEDTSNSSNSNNKEIDQKNNENNSI
jgi:hypothetical protein